MSHERECGACLHCGEPCICSELRAAYLRGREDERGFNSCSQCGDDLTSPFICFGCLEENAAAAREDGAK